MSMSEAAGTLARVIAVRSPARGVVLIVAASGFFAVNGSVAKLVIQAGIGPAHLTTLRASGAFLALLGGVLVHDARRLAVRRQELATLVVFGLTGLFLVPMLYFVAISRLPVGIGLLFEYTAPLLVALWARFGQRRPVRTRLWGGLVLSLAGLACVAEVWGQVRLDRVGIRPNASTRASWPQSSTSSTPPSPISWWTCRGTPSSSSSQPGWRTPVRARGNPRPPPTPRRVRGGHRRRPRALRPLARPGRHAGAEPAPAARDGPAHPDRLGVRPRRSRRTGELVAGCAPARPRHRHATHGQLAARRRQGPPTSADTAARHGRPATWPHRPRPAGGARLPRPAPAD